MNGSVEEKLKQMKKSVDEAKQARSRLEGSLSQLMASLGKFGVNSIEEAKSLLETKKRERDTLQETIEARLKSIEERYEF